ncbi:MAG: hypothetical protein GX594_06990 [Pirellulaceae bacterium]|nr:hypothetical protein [Pirellulaceae bacterium]
MFVGLRNWRFRLVSSIVVLFFITTAVTAVEGQKRLRKIGEYDPNAQTVEMFAAIEKGDIAVKLIAKDSTECNILIENKTDKPLNVELPKAFAGVPVLGQGFGGIDGGRGGGRTGTGTGGGNQGMGGGMGGMGGGMFCVPPEKVGKFKLPAVCLEHGKDEPRAAIPYEIKPIESFTTKAGVRETCEMLGMGQLDQRAAQAAAWHLNCDMSWEELAAKRIRHANGSTEPYFSPVEIQAGMTIAATAVKTAKEREEEKAKETQEYPNQ